jgi:hypothetical protein
MRGPALLLLAALALGAGGDRHAARAAAAPAGPPPRAGSPARTLVAAVPALGGGWDDALVRRWGAMFDVVVVGASARSARVRAFRAVNPDIVVLAYTNGFDVHESAPLCGWIRARHPAWLLRDAGARPLHAYRDPLRWALDCGDLEVRGFFADSVRRRVRELGADGIFEDNVMPTFAVKTLARGADRIEGYATVAAWRAALEEYVGALERAVAPGWMAVNQVVPWTRHGAVVCVEDVPMGGPAWEEIVRGFQALAREPGRVPWLQQHLSGPDDPSRPFATATFLLAVEPGAWLGLDWRPKEAMTRAPEYDLELGRPLGAARRQGAIWWRDFERARVLVNAGLLPGAAPLPASSARRSFLLPGHRAALAWRPGAPRIALPGWIVP